MEMCMLLTQAGSGFAGSGRSRTRRRRLVSTRVWPEREAGTQGTEGIPMPLSKIGKYERVDVLGHGASGIVYLAWDTLLKKQIALKEIDLQAADISRFLEEARVMDRLNHPNIVRVNCVDKLDGHIVIDMEYVKGRNLQATLR